MPSENDDADEDRRGGSWLDLLDLTEAFVLVARGVWALIALLWGLVTA